MLVATRTERGGGPDYKDYYNYFYFGTRGIEKEIGYALLNKIVYYIFGDFNIFMIIVGICIVGGRIIYIYKYSPVVILSLLIYYTGNYLTLDFDVFRQGIALSIILVFSIKYIEKGDVNKFIISVLCATSFHLSAFIFLIAYYVRKIEFKVRTYIIILFSSLIIGITNLVSIAIKIANIIPSTRLQSKYEQYFSGTGISGLGIGFITDFILVIFILYFIYKGNFKNNLNVKLFLLGFIGECLLIRYPSGRFMLYFTFSKVILYPLILTKFKHLFIKYSYILFIIAQSLVKFYISYNSATNAIWLYESFLFK